MRVPLLRVGWQKKFWMRCFFGGPRIPCGSALTPSQKTGTLKKDTAIRTSFDSILRQHIEALLALVEIPQQEGRLKASYGFGLCPAYVPGLSRISPGLIYYVFLLENKENKSFAGSPKLRRLLHHFTPKMRNLVCLAQTTILCWIPLNFEVAQGWEA